jgi:hypothetical protein
MAKPHTQTGTSHLFNHKAYLLFQISTFSSIKITELPHDNVYLNKQVSHFILHFINEKFNTSQDLRLGSVQNRIAEIHIQSLRILL